MKLIIYTAIVGLLGALLISCNQNDHNQHSVAQHAAITAQDTHAQPADTMDNYEVTKTEEEWRELLSSGEYRILRSRGTELPYVNEYYDNKKEGVYYCGACGNPIFTSETKYESGTGWPSFWQPIKPSVVGEREDNSLFMTRTESVCARCGSHLGHVFEDGPEPTGLRYCLNSQALDFVEMDLSSVNVEDLPVKEKD
ncbi:peptide-methionine (R)-S-oxide reductase MsrB [Aliifodinibius sp. 1BSP15-2V2]|uniref:Peptide methionine sulfoxide reductase MsrB n=2 Tax=Fodinibius salsisoli TaxID=2820877 RepID=A0ABT3PQS9_9BACT|nr:peptide-methionine (R)-S-oxide reductase MsrB [Fodinibius salsisoli]